jgi:hypothetical protein
MGLLMPPNISSSKECRCTHLVSLADFPAAVTINLCRIQQCVVDQSA